MQACCVVAQAPIMSVEPKAHTRELGISNICLPLQLGAASRLVGTLTFAASSKLFQRSIGIIWNFNLYGTVHVLPFSLARRLRM